MYGPGGYYQSGNGVGADFDTCANRDTPLASRIGRWLDEKWVEQGSPDCFNVYELAAGDGTLCRKILSLNLQCAKAIRYTAIETNPIYKDSFPEKVDIADRLPSGPLCGVIFANELIDCQPVRFVSYRDGCWQELFIHVSDKAQYEWRPVKEEIPQTLQVIKTMDGSAPWVQESANLLHQLSQDFTGDMLMIDYGYRKTVDFPGRPWFRCWLNYKLVPALDLTILPDMSALMPVDQLEELFYPAKVTEQASWISGNTEPHDNFYVMEWCLRGGKPL